MAPAQEEETEEEAAERERAYAQRRKEYEEERQRKEERQQQFEKEQKEREAEQARREKVGKARQASFERILENAPAMFTPGQLRVFLGLCAVDPLFGFVLNVRVQRSGSFSVLPRQVWSTCCVSLVGHGEYAGVFRSGSCKHLPLWLLETESCRELNAARIAHSGCLSKCCVRRIRICSRSPGGVRDHIVAMVERVE